MIGRRALNSMGLGAAALGAMTGLAQAQPRERTVTIASGNDATGLAPIDAWIVTPDVMLIEHICDPLLIRWKSDQVGPCLAESWRIVDDLTWEFKLRAGVEFHNGEKVTSHAFKLFFDVISNPETRSNLRSSHAHVAEVRVIDDLTFQVITREPTPAALTAFVLHFPIPPDYFASVGLAGYRRRPIGTGAFRLQERLPDQRIVLVANDKYWGGPQAIRRVVYRPIREAASRAAALLAGEIDIALDLPPELTSMVSARPGIAVKTAATGRVMFLTLNFARPELPTANVKVREAINFAIDRESLVRDVMGGQGAPVAFCPPFVTGFDPANPPIRRDLARARRLMAEAGFPNGVDIELDTSNGRYLKDKESAEAIAGQLGEAGIRVTVRPLDWALMQRRMYGGTGAPLALTAFLMSGDVHNFNANSLRTGGTNTAGSSPELDEIIAAVSREMNPERRIALIHRQQQILNQVWPKAFLLQLGAVAAVGRNAAFWEPRWDDRVRMMTNTVLG